MCFFFGAKRLGHRTPGVSDLGELHLVDGDLATMIGGDEALTAIRANGDLPPLLKEKEHLLTPGPGPRRAREVRGLDQNLRPLKGGHPPRRAGQVPAPTNGGRRGIKGANDEERTPLLVSPLMALVDEEIGRALAVKTAKLSPILTDEPVILQEHLLVLLKIDLDHHLPRGGVETGVLPAASPLASADHDSALVALVIDGQGGGDGGGAGLHAKLQCLHF